MLVAPLGLQLRLSPASLMPGLPTRPPPGWSVPLASASSAQTGLCRGLRHGDQQALRAGFALANSTI